MFDKLRDKWKKASGLEKAGVVAAAAPLAPLAGVAGLGMAVKAGGDSWHKNRHKRPGWQRKQMFRNDLAKLQEGPQALGLSEDEKARMYQEQMDAANAQANAQQQAIAQQALAGGEFQQQAFADAQQDVAQQQLAAAGQAQAQVQNADQQRSNQEADRIRGDIKEREERNRELTAYWTNFGINLAAQIASTAAGLPGATAAAGTGPMTASGASGARDVSPPQEVEGVDNDTLDSMRNESW